MSEENTEVILQSSRHAARFILIMSLYSYDINDKNLQLKAIVSNISNAYLNKDIFYLNLDEEFFNKIEFQRPDNNFLDSLASIYRNNIEEIENILKSSLIAKYSIEKLDKVIRAVISLVALELLYCADIPTKVIIDEYVSLTKCFYEDSEAGFINKVAEVIAKKVRA